MKSIIFIGGATACGKSTLTDSLNEMIPYSLKYRRYQGFFDLAKERNISDNNIFKEINSQEVDDYFINICKENEVVISDVHYAVQMNRNDKNNINIYDNYVPTISKELICKLVDEDIRIITVFLTCSPEECLKRASLRYIENKKNIRNISIEDATIERIAEEREWNNLVDTGLVEGIELSSELFSKDQLSKELLSRIFSNDEKALKKIIE